MAQDRGDSDLTTTIEPDTVEEHESPGPAADDVSEAERAEQMAELHSVITDGTWRGCCAGCLDLFGHVKPWPCTSAVWAAGVIGGSEREHEPVAVE